MVSAESAITSGSVRTFEFTPTTPGDHAYRSGVLKWAVPQGMWGILRVDPGHGHAAGPRHRPSTGEMGVMPGEPA
jgi:hypothetical protein